MGCGTLYRDNEPIKLREIKKSNKNVKFVRIVGMKECWYDMPSFDKKEPTDRNFMNLQLIDSELSNNPKQLLDEAIKYFLSH